MTRVSPVVEMVSPMVDSVKTSVEEQLTNYIPTGISETVQTVQAKAVDQVIAAVEKVKSSVTSFVTGWSEYFASFSMALVTLKVVDATLVKVETILKAVECDTAKTVSSYVKTIHDTANTLRIGAVKSAGTPLAKKIEDDTIPESLMEISGLQSVMERLGFVGGEVPEINEDVTEDAKVADVNEDDAKVDVNNTDVTEEDAKVDVNNTDVTE